MNINTAFKSKFLKGAEIEADTVYTISHVDQENVGGADKEEVKPVLYFEETEKGLVLNRTNSNTIASLYGPETDDWAGKKITLFSTEVDFQGKQTLAIRVRMKKPAAAAPAKSGAGIASKGPSNPARTKAWTQFCEVTPNLEMDNRAAAWAAAIKEVYPGKDERTLTPAEWTGFTAALKDYDESTESFIPV